MADRFELRGGIQLNARLTGAAFDEVANRWLATAQSSDANDHPDRSQASQSWSARFLVCG